MTDMRYIEFSETEVLDTQTNLVWRKDFAETMTHARALEYARQVVQETGIAWRVPTVAELAGLLDWRRSSPASEFPGMPARPFWSSMHLLSNSHFAWGVNFTLGNVSNYPRDYHFAVRLVRDAIP